MNEYVSQKNVQSKIQIYKKIVGVKIMYFFSYDVILFESLISFLAFYSGFINIKI